jgi:hypothetical protein
MWSFLMDVMAEQQKALPVQAMHGSWATCFLLCLLLLTLPQPVAVPALPYSR